jgi:hypothetical protein
MRPWLPLVTLCGVLFLAQPAAAQPFSYGGRGGLSISNISFEPSTFSGAPDGVGLIAGGFIGVPLFGRVSLQGEAAYAETRVVLEDIVHDTMKYLDVPILVRYRVFGTRPKMRVHAIGGVVWSSLLSAKEVVGSSTADLTDGVESSDLSLAIGGEVEVFPRWLVDVRYLFGMDEVYKQFNAPSFGLRRGLQITAIYRVH